MGGVCVTYTSDNDMQLILGLGRQKYVPCTYFKQTSNCNGKKISSEESAKNLASIKFEMHGEHGTNAVFNIKSVGPYNGGECHP